MADGRACSLQVESLERLTHTCVDAIPISLSLRDVENDVTCMVTRGVHVPRPTSHDRGQCALRRGVAIDTLGRPMI